MERSIVVDLVGWIKDTLLHDMNIYLGSSTNNYYLDRQPHQDHIVHSVLTSEKARQYDERVASISALRAQ